jgi:hypothetical protein
MALDTGQKASPLANMNPGTMRIQMNSEKQWTVPPLDYMKINIDGAYFAISRKAMLGVIIRDHEGNPVLTAWRLLFNCRDAEEAETLACLDGTRLANRWPDCAGVLEFDYAALVTKLNSSHQDRSIVASLNSDIKDEISQRSRISIVKIPRVKNRVAHDLAHFALISNRSQVSFSFILSCIQDLVANEPPIYDGVDVYGDLG